MKNGNAIKNKKLSLRWTLTVGAAAGIFSLWGLLANTQSVWTSAASATQNDGTTPTVQTDAAQLAIPTLVPEVQSSLTDSNTSVDSSANSSLNSFTFSRRPSPFTTTRSSR